MLHLKILFLRIGPLHTMGELCLSPVGLSYIHKLSPKHLLGLLIGVFFLSNSIGPYLGGMLAGLVGYMAQERSMAEFFIIFFILSLASSIILYLIAPVLKKWMHGVH